jgi:hypothetical protein
VSRSIPRPSTESELERLQRTFLDIVPRIEAHGRIYFRNVRCQSRLEECLAEKTKDVMSPRAQQMRGFTVAKLPDFSTLSTNPLVEALTDNTQTPPDEAAAFRIDFPAWLIQLGDRRRRIAEDLMMGERTMDVANQQGVSPGRISQLRREFKGDWQHFCGENPSLSSAPLS